MKFKEDPGAKRPMPAAVAPPVHAVHRPAVRPAVGGVATFAQSGVPNRSKWATGTLVWSKMTQFG